jgi:hypothetical protein
MDAISANDPAMQSTPCHLVSNQSERRIVICALTSTEITNPYITDTGPPLTYAAANRALMASQVPKVQADNPSKAQRSHSRCQGLARRTVRRVAMR